MQTNRVKVPAKIKAQLQQEVSSECPFCSNKDVGCFEIHHIDGIRTNNDYMNLLLLCPTCHTKIEKGEISYDEVVKCKAELQLSNGKIEFVSVVADGNICNWEVGPENEFSFYNKENKNKSEYPILNFSFINHLSKTVILKTIEVKVKDLPRGLSGFGPDPKVLRSLVKYSLQLKFGNTINRFHLTNPISVPSDQSFLFQVELSMGTSPDATYPIDGRKAMYFTFHFSNGVKITIPTICFNCNDENEPMKLYILS